MNYSFDIWSLLAGAVLFLIGIGFMEEATKLLAGRRFKLFLKKQTTNKVKAIFGGAVATALMQSSSVINLLILSLVGAGVLKMNNALAVMLGSNVGTTFTSWIIATFGFKINVESFALPLLAVAGLTYFFSKPNSNWSNSFRFLIGFSFLFVGLGYMNNGMLDFVKSTNLAAFSTYPVLFFLLVGLVLTALVQASSVTIAITLSALYAKAINLPMAAAIVLGAEIGTTLKLAIASLNGSAPKKRVALGNILFNSVTALIMLLFLNPVLNLITVQLQLQDPLIGLVFFQSMLNILGVFLFFPFLNLFGNFLENRYQTNKETIYINDTDPADTANALEALHKETNHFIAQVGLFCVHAFDPENKQFSDDIQENAFEKKSITDMYTHVKQLYGSIHSFCIRLTNQSMSSNEVERTAKLMSSLRNAMYAAKSMKDALTDIEQLRNSSNDEKFAFFLKSKKEIEAYYKQVFLLLKESDKNRSFELLSELYNNIQLVYAEKLSHIYHDHLSNQLNEIEISTLLNFNRELITSHKSMIFSLKDFLLTRQQALYFEEQPGFIR